MWNCKFCNISFDRKNKWETHLNTKKHKKNVDIFNKILEDSKKDSPLPVDDPISNDKIEIDEPMLDDPFIEECMMKNTEKTLVPTNLTMEYFLLEMNKMRNDFSNIIIKMNTQHKKEINKLRNDLEIAKNRPLTQNFGDINHSTLNMQRYINENQFRVELHVHAFGSEDLSHITDNIMTQLMSQPVSFVNRWVRNVHFNERYPQNMNIKIKNVKDNFYQIYNGDTWRNVDKKKFLEYMVADIFNQAETRNCTDDSSIELWKTLSNRYKPLWVQTIEQATDGEHPNHKAFVKDLKNRLDAEIKTQQKRHDDKKKAVNDKRLRVWHKLPPTIETIEEIVPTKNPYKCITGLINEGVI